MRLNVLIEKYNKVYQDNFRLKHFKNIEIVTGLYSEINNAKNSIEAFKLVVDNLKKDNKYYSRAIESGLIIERLALKYYIRQQIKEIKKIKGIDTNWFTTLIKTKQKLSNILIKENNEINKGLLKYIINEIDKFINPQNKDFKNEDFTKWKEENLDFFIKQNIKLMIESYTREKNRIKKILIDM